MEGEPIDPDEGNNINPDDPSAINNAEEAISEANAAEDALKDKTKTEAEIITELYGKQLEIIKNDIKENVDNSEEAEELNKFMDNLKNKIEKSKDSQGRPDYDKVLKSLFDGDKFTPGDLYEAPNSIDKEKTNKALNKYIKKYKGRSVAAIKDVFPDFMEKLTKNQKIGTIINEENFTADESVTRQEEAQDLAEEQVTEDADEKFKNNAADRAAKDIESGKKPNTGGRFIDPKTLLKILSLLLSVGSLGIFAWWTIITAMNLSGCKEISCTEEEKFPTAKPVKCFQRTKPNIFNPNDTNTINFNSAACQCDFPDGVTEDNYTTKLKGCTSDTCNNPDEQDNLRPYGPGCERAGKLCSKGENISCPFYSYSYSISTPFDALGNTFNGAMNGFNKEANSLLELLKKIGIYTLIALGVILLLYVIYKLANHYLPKNNNISKYGNSNYFLSGNSNYFLSGICEPIETIKTLRPPICGKLSIV